jgi:hypothetical protein
MMATAAASAMAPRSFLVKRAAASLFSSIGRLTNVFIERRKKDFLFLIL